MGFWIFMLCVNLIFPLTMVLVGKYYTKKSPENINMLVGYRTSMSTKNKDTWEFAHKKFGKIWYRTGLVITPLSIIAMLFFIGKDENTVGIAGEVLCLLQIATVIGTIFPVEKALKQNFDKNGNRKQ